MDKEIYIVERWLVDHGEYIYAGVFCFEERDVAEAFVEHMQSDDPDMMFMLFPDYPFTNVNDAAAAARGR